MVTNIHRFTVSQWCELYESILYDVYRMITSLLNDQL